MREPSVLIINQDALGDKLYLYPINMLYLYFMGYFGWHLSIRLHSIVIKMKQHEQKQTTQMTSARTILHCSICHKDKPLTYMQASSAHIYLKYPLQTYIIGVTNMDLSFANSPLRVMNHWKCHMKTFNIQHRGRVRQTATRGATQFLPSYRGMKGSGGGAVNIAQAVIIEQYSSVSQIQCRLQE